MQCLVVRYLTKDGKFSPHPKMAAFGLGRRRCLGETLARLELYMFFTAILSRCSFFLPYYGLWVHIYCVSTHKISKNYL